MLLAGDGVARFDTRVHRIEDFWLDLHVVAQALIVLVPVGIFDDEPQLGINGLAGLDQQVLRGLVESFQAVLRPAFVSLGRDVGGHGLRAPLVVESGHLGAPRGGELLPTLAEVAHGRYEDVVARVHEIDHGGFH